MGVVLLPQVQWCSCMVDVSAFFFLLIIMIKNIKDNSIIYGLIIVKTNYFLLVLDYGLSNATFEPPNHAFTLKWQL
jgi:hypothetical protein